MTAKQGIQLFNTMKMQMNSVEQNKFQNMILEQVEDRQKKLAECLEKFQKKHCRGQKLKSI
ncbi:hypothetical protein [Algoriella sp.]|uniref:hypothetical protein n=1 Tax=Algoriella sp. TaxID=1872434 RepID=UPI002FC6D573